MHHTPLAVHALGVASDFCAGEFCRWVRDARELRLQRKVQRMRLQSDAAQLQREMHQLQSQLQAEKRLQQSIEQQLRETQRARLAHNANQTGWQLGAVQMYHNRVVQAAPVRVSERRCRPCAELYQVFLARER